MATTISTRGPFTPNQLFLIFNELVEAELYPRDGFNPAYMIDQSHNVTDPIESLLSSAEALAASLCKSLLVNLSSLRQAQEENDAMMAFRILRRAYLTDVSPIWPWRRDRPADGVPRLRLPV